jgi:hypothetical protein
MKVGPKEQQTKTLGPSGIERQYASPLKAGYIERQPVTQKAVTSLRKSVTKVANKSVTHKSVTGKRGPKPKGEAAMSAAERMKAYRARKKVK